MLVGGLADILVYDQSALRSRPEDVAYDFPGGEWRRIERAVDYDYTTVHGVIIFGGLRCTGTMPGKRLLHGWA